VGLIATINDAQGNLTSIEDANNNATSFSYDAFGPMTKATFPSGYIEMSCPLASRTRSYDV